MKSLSIFTLSFKSCCFFLLFYKLYSYSFYFLLVFLSFSFSFPALSFEDDIAFELKRQVKKENPKPTKKRKALEFQRQSFTYSDDFELLNKAPKAPLKSGTVLKVDFLFPFPALPDEEIEVVATVISPFQAGLWGKVKAIKNTNQAVLTFEEFIFNEKVYSIETYPVFLTGKLQEFFLKDLALEFFKNIPIFISWSLTSFSNLSQFINKDLKNKTKELSNKTKELSQKVKKLSLKENQKNQKEKIRKPLKINKIKIIKVIVK